MGWLRNLLLFPDNAWQEAAGKLGAEFVQGRWLANNEINLSHRDYPMKIGIGSSKFARESQKITEYTKVMSSVSLRPGVKQCLMPKLTGLFGAFVNTALSSVGTSIELPLLGDDYQVIGADAKLAGRIFGNQAFLSALRSMPIDPTVVVNSSPRNRNSHDNGLCVLVRNVVKDTHQLVAMANLTKILLDVLEENDCLLGNAIER